MATWAYPPLSSKEVERRADDSLVCDIHFFFFFFFAKFFS